MATEPRKKPTMTVVLKGSKKNVRRRTQMKNDQWSTLHAWFYKNYKTLPKDVANAIDTLLDEHQSEDDAEEEEEEEEEVQ
jgi:hypothetical protein